ncbi:MAG TPA: helix-hairpin-helix domain-containing protein [Chitinophagaceae bacterium]|nr:helix-hairpin-helix domain-containing protein [Chitinophagaceae bacterium]
MKWSEFIKDYLTFTRKERIGILVIVGLILFTLFLPEMLKKSSGNNPVQVDTAWMTAVKKLEIKVPDSSADHFQKKDEENTFAYQYDKPKSNYDESNSAKGELFYFDPNTISVAEWKKLGLRDKAIQTIEKYLSKGGHFYKPEDLQKIYGLHKDEYERLAPYVKIETKSLAANEQFVPSKTKDEIQPAKNYAAHYTAIDINNADTIAFISLPGIGSKLAARIVTFRDKLGGFYSIEQVRETYGLPDSTFQKIKQWLKLDNASVKKININTATVDELKAHPYIKYSIANTIVAYRNEHGLFSKIEDIKKVMAVTNELYDKIVSYLSVQ